MKREQQSRGQGRQMKMSRGWGHRVKRQKRMFIKSVA